MNKRKLASTDIIRAAMQMEEHGRNFYLAMAARTKEVETKQMFTKLAEEEKEHFKFFKRMLDQNVEFEIDESEEDFLEAITAKIEFPNVEQHADETEDIKEALAIGIQAEKDSILLYHELSEEVQNPELKKVIHGLLKAEKMHLVELREHLEELS